MFPKQGLNMMEACLIIPKNDILDSVPQFFEWRPSLHPTVFEFNQITNISLTNTFSVVCLLFFKKITGKNIQQNRESQKSKFPLSLRKKR